MIRTAARSHPARVAAALAGVAGVFVLAGCGSTAADPGPGSADEGGSSGSFADGTYTADGTYQTPESVETLTVTVTLTDGVVDAVEVDGDPQTPESEQYQGQFIGGIADEVVGRRIDEIQVSRVAGSSLSSGGFNRAIEAILSEAAA